MLSLGKMIIDRILDLSLTGTAWAEATNDPSTGAQLNRCWGDIASQVAKPDSDNVTGGGMGAHSRSPTTAGINGDFGAVG